MPQPGIFSPSALLEQRVRWRGDRRRDANNISLRRPGIRAADGGYRRRLERLFARPLWRSPLRRLAQHIAYAMGASGRGEIAQPLRCAAVKAPARLLALAMRAAFAATLALNVLLRFGAGGLSRLRTSCGGRVSLSVPHLLSCLLSLFATV